MSRQSGNVRSGRKRGKRWQYQSRNEAERNAQHGEHRHPRPHARGRVDRRGALGSSRLTEQDQADDLREAQQRKCRRGCQAG